MALLPVVGRNQPHIRIAWWAMFTILSVGVLLHAAQFYFVIITSLKTGYEALSPVPTLWPKDMTFAGWLLAFNIASDDPALAGLVGDNPFIVYFWNSIFMVGVTLALSMPITSLAAYVNSKLLRGPLARWSFLFFIGTMMLPAAVTLVPSILLTLNFPFAVPQGTVPNIPGTDTPFPTIQFFNTPWAVIIPTIFNAFNFLLFKGFFDTIPNSVIQAARVDGGSEINIFRRIVLPMSVPVYAVATYLQFSSLWDNFLWPQLVIQDASVQPLSVAIYNIVRTFTNEGSVGSQVTRESSARMAEMMEMGLSWNGLMVLGLLQTLPTFILFIFCYRYLLKGIHIRGLK